MVRSYARTLAPSTTEQPSLQTLLTVNQVASAMNVSPRTIWRYLSTGRIPEPIRISGTVRWRSTEISFWIESGCPMPVQQPRNNHHPK